MFTVYNEEENKFHIVEEPDPSLSYTYADYLKWNFEERIELFKGRIFQLSAPNTKHQEISGRLFLHVGNFLLKKPCKVFSAPFDVRLAATNKEGDHEITTVVQPDICIICDESKLDDKGCCGAPDLVVEILSPGNSNREIRLKFELYEEAGVREYWIVYPTEESVAVFVLNENRKYSGARLYATDETIASASVAGLTVNLKDIFTK